MKLIYPNPIIPLSIRSLVEKRLTQMKSSNPHVLLTTLMNNNRNLKEEQPQEYQHLRLALWDIPGSALSSEITHQVFHLVNSN